MERFTKIFITLWACAAVAWQITRLQSWPQLPFIAALVALTALALTLWDRRAIALVVAPGYFVPVIVRLVHGPNYVPFAVLWIAALVGAMLPDGLRTSWHVPTRWRGALVFAAFAAVIGSAIVVSREIDGAMPLATSMTNMYWVGSIPPPFLVSWVLHVTIGLVVGVLWFDWMCGAPQLDAERFIVTPLVFSAAAMSAVSAYQMFFDIHVFNETAFANMERATGTMYDANVAGMLSALWVGGTYVWAERLRGWRIYAAPPFMALDALAAWGSGSRSALLVVVITAVFAAVGGIVALRRQHQFRRLVVFAAVAVVVVLAAGFAAAGAGTVNPFNRLRASLPSPDVTSIRRFGSELRARNGYGTASELMIREFPVAGVGVGSFQTFVAEYGDRFQTWLPPDNAQSWLRHQIAEFGFVGALGWIVWFVSFAAFVIVPRRTDGPGIWTLRGTLCGFGGLSLMAMPGQDVMVVMTFWTIALWYARLAGLPPAARPLRPVTWVAMTAALAIFAVGSVSAASGALHLTERARRLKAPLSYGFAPPELSGADAGFRRTQTRALTLVDVVPGWMSVSVKLKTGTRLAAPIDVRITKDDDVVLKAMLTGDGPVTTFVPIVKAGRIVLMATARAEGGSPLRNLFSSPEALVKWEFVEYPPPGFKGYDERSAVREP